LPEAFKVTRLNEVSKNPTFCSLAWDHQFLDPTGRVKPCCRFEERHRPPQNHLSQNSLKDVFYGEWMEGVREKMLKGLPVDGCARCYQEQSAGKKSLRERYNSSVDLPMEELVDLARPSLKWLELAISNDCNLACRMCDSRYSHRWYEEELRYIGKTKSPLKKTAIDIDQLNPFLPDLVHLKFTGGEPLMTRQHWQLLERLTQSRDCSSVSLNYSTNCTIAPQKGWVELWNQFRLVEFALSLDSIDPNESEYVRWPAKHGRIMDVTKSFLQMAEKQKFVLILRTTVSLLNVWSLVDTIDWWIRNHPHQKMLFINPTHLTHPEILSLTILPENIKQRVASHLAFRMQQLGPSKYIQKNVDYIIRYMNSRDDSRLLKQLKIYLDNTDEYRSQSFYNSYPHYQDLFVDLK
jgi:molybdenum cofactor biosynthesis enzyme MoaA